MRRMILVAALACPLVSPLAAAAGGLTAGRTLPAGSLIAAGDLLSEPGSNPAAADALIGLETRVTIYAGHPVTPAQLQEPRLITRNQIAPLIFQSGALRIETSGRALAEGGAGETIPVMNLASRQTVSAEIAADGTLIIFP